MAVNFPNSPTIGQQFTVNNVTREWNGTAWISVASSVQGVTGAQGSTGVQGLTGSFGGAAFEYVYETSFPTEIHDDFPSGVLGFDNTTISSATTLLISYFDANNTDVTSFLDTVDDSTSSVKGNFKLQSSTNPENFVMVSITGSHINYNNHYHIPVSYLSGSVTSFTDAEEMQITFQRTGDIGDTGPQGIQGLTGIQGTQGTTGETGLQGIQGLQGTTGTQGTTGIQGLLGFQGIQGLQGEQGLQGTEGSQGVTGIQGTEGLQGIQGATGIQGIQGLQGDTGTQGIQGFQGLQGFGFAQAQGTQGLQGRQGIQGFQGAFFVQSTTAPTGGIGSAWYDPTTGKSYVYDGTYWVEVGTAPIGPIGIQGIQGLLGFQGIQGRQGIQGTQGIQGVQGLQGTQGLLGNQGIQGLSFQGIQGFSIQGIQGTQGLQGLQGLQGIQGLQGFGFAQAQGTQGIQGLLGNQGIQGLQGSTGTQGVTGLQGLQGIQGIQGDTGSQGLLGIQGLTGFEGIQGVQGITGLQGLLGIQGATGLQGTFGNTGTQGIQGPSAATTPTDTVVNGKLSSNQTITSGSDSLISFVDDFDPQGWWDPSTKRFQPNIAGYYNVTLSVWWVYGAVTSQTNVQMRKNGNSFAIYQALVETDTDSGKTLGGSKLAYLNGSTDYIDFVAYTGNTTSQVLQQGNSDGSGTYFSAALMTTGVGVDGATGAQGTQGLQGLQGVQGIEGIQGALGVQGILGIQGTTSTIPAGTISMYAGSSAPSGYLLCDGQSLDSVTNTEYAALYGVIGTTYGGSDASAFNVPNLKGSVPVGLDSTQTEFDTLGETGGAKTHTLTSAEVPLHTHTTNIGHGHADTLAAPAHTHNIGHGHADTLAAPAHSHKIDPPNTGTTSDAHTHSTNTAGDASAFLSGSTNNVRYTDTSSPTLNTSSDTHSHSVNIAEFDSGGASATALTGAVTDLPTTASGGASATALSGTVTDLPTTDVTSSSSGSGGAHNNLQPYIVLNYIIKV